MRSETSVVDKTKRICVNIVNQSALSKIRRRTPLKLSVRKQPDCSAFKVKHNSPEYDKSENLSYIDMLKISISVPARVEVRNAIEAIGRSGGSYCY